MDKHDLIQQLSLQQHPEGGYYSEIYRSGMMIETDRVGQCKLGLNLSKGEMPQLLVPGGYWKAAVLEEGEFGLLGEAVAPGFDFRDMEFAQSIASKRD